MTEPCVMKQHFTFEMYAPTSTSESGIPIVERVSVQMQGDNLTITDILAKFEDFLKSCGYAALLENKYVTVAKGND